MDTNQSPCGTSIPSGLQALRPLLPSCPGPFPHPWVTLHLLRLGLGSHRASRSLLPGFPAAPPASQLEQPRSWSSLAAASWLWLPQGGARGQRGSLAETLCPGSSVKPPRGLRGNWEAGCCGRLGRPSGSLKVKLRPQNSPLRGAAGIFTEKFVCVLCCRKRRRAHAACAGTGRFAPCPPLFPPVALSGGGDIQLSPSPPFDAVLVSSP